MRIGFRGHGTAFKHSCILSLAALCLHVASMSQGAFAPPINVNSKAATDTRDNFIPAVASAPDGVTITVWGSIGPNPVSPAGDDSANANGLNEDLYFARSFDGGRSWGSKTVLKTNAATDNADDVDPAIATDGQGRWMAVWRSCDSLNNTIGNDRDILYTFSSDNGLTWSVPKPVNSDASSDSSRSDLCPGVACVGPNQWIVSWIAFEGGQSELFVARTVNNGQDWSTPRLMIGVPGNYYFTVPIPAADGKGRAIITFSATPTGISGNQEKIYFFRTADFGISWSMEPLNATGMGNSSVNTFPRVATDKLGNWVIAWSSTDSLSGALGTEGDILFSRSTDNGLTWSVPASLNTDAKADGSGSDTEVHIASNGQTFMAIWTVFKYGGNEDLAYATSTDGGATWSAPQRLSADPIVTGDSTAYGGNSALSLSPTYNNGYVAVWNSNRDRSRFSHPWEILSAVWPHNLVPVEFSSFAAE